MPVTIEVPPGCDIILGLNSADPEDAADAQRIITRRQQRRQGVPTALVQHVAKTKAGRIFVKPLATAMLPNTPYTAASLAQILGNGWSARRVASKLCVLGRPEKQFHARLFERPADGEYVITPEMKAAILAA